MWFGQLMLADKAGLFKHVNALVLKLLPQSAHSLLGILKDLSSAGNLKVK